MNLQVYAEKLPTSDEIYNGLMPSEKTRGLSIEKREKPSMNFTVNFDYNSAVITKASEEILNHLGSALSKKELSAYNFQIIGHTDAKGDAQFNLDLSNRRAKAVAEYLINNFSIPSSHLTPIGKGKSELLPGIDPFDGKNRRVQVINLLTK
jgi:outer membrane protein OmpA-like peptidoglycan-associated protein